MTTAQTIQLTRPAKVDYTYEFEPDDFEGIQRCNQEHGFAVVKQLIDRDLVERLKAAVVREAEKRGPMEDGGTRVIHAFVEHAPDEQLAFLHEKKWLALQEFLLGTRELTVHRSACIYKKPGARAIAWHSDWSGFHEGPPRNANDVLNVGEKPSGGWFYLTGTRPDHAGLCVIPGSQEMDWQPGEGYEFSGPDRRFLVKSDDPDRRPVTDIDVPGCFPIVSDPGDMIVFAARTFHYAGDHNGDYPRLSCGGLGFRAGREPWPVPWKMPESYHQLMARLTPEERPYFEHYASIDIDWRPEGE